LLCQIESDSCPSALQSDAGRILLPASDAGDTPDTGYCIHALNAVYIETLGEWIRIDTRGNKPGIDAQFSLDEEQLAFPIRREFDERDYDVIYANPHPLTMDVLLRHSDCLVMYASGLPAEL